MITSLPCVLYMVPFADRLTITHCVENTWVSPWVIKRDISLLVAEVWVSAVSAEAELV